MLPVHASNMFDRLRIAVLLGALAAAPVSAQSVQAGIEAWQKADYKSAVEIWRPLAEAGDADAQFNLGQAYRLGRGVAVNLAAAQTWLTRAAGKSHVDAQTTLGLLLFDSGDREGGVRWLGSAAERGDPRAMLVYGTALFNGDGVKRNPVLAYAYVSRAAAQGLAPARTTLEEMDKAIPLAQRKQGVRLALAKASAAAAKPSAKAAPKAPAKAPGAASAQPQEANAGPVSGGWRVQLGAFSHRASAEALFRRISGNAALAGRRPFYIPAGAVTRLQVGPFASRAAASNACAAMRGQPCFPVPAR
jgi:cell division septation protein DedD